MDDDPAPHRFTLLRHRAAPFVGIAPASSTTRSGGWNAGRIHRIGLLIDSLIGGGAERVVLNLACAFREQGHEVDVILMRREVQHAVPQGVRLHAVAEAGEDGSNKFAHKMMLAWRLRSLVARLEQQGRPFDFFISSAEDSDRLSAMAGLPRTYIRYRNSMYEYLRHKIGRKSGLKRAWRELKWRTYFRAVYGGRDIVTVSNAMHADIVVQAGVKPRSLRTIYNPFDFAALREQSAAYVPGVEGPYLVYAARINSRKRQDLLLDAFARSSAHRTHKLVLLGDAYTESERQWLASLHERIAALGLRERVLMPGFQTNPYPWIRNADLFVMSSDSEGLPTVLIESLILGTPVVSTDCPTGPSEILTGALAGYLCPRGDALRLAELIDSALQEYPAIEEASLSRFSAAYSAQQYLAHCAPKAPPARSGRLASAGRRFAWWATAVRHGITPLR